MILKDSLRQIIFFQFLETSPAGSKGLLTSSSHYHALLIDI